MNTPQSSSAKLPSKAVSKSSRLPLDCILAFLLIITIISALGVFTTKQSKIISQESVAINIAGRQRMLTQSQAKSLYLLGLSQYDKTSIDRSKELANLKNSERIFGQTLQAFSRGGETLSSDSQNYITLEAVSDPDLRQIVSETDDVWRDYSQQIGGIISQTPDQLDQQKLGEAIKLAQQSSLPLLKLSNDLTHTIEKNSTQRQKTLNLIQIVGVVGVFGLFMWMSVRILRSLRANSKALESNINALATSNEELERTQTELQQKANSLQHVYQELREYSSQIQKTSTLLRIQQEESESIFSAVNEGLCLIDREYKIGKQISDEMFEIFQQDELTGVSLLELLRPHITERDLRSLESYLELQFDPRTAETQLDKYNPLEKVEVTFDWDGGGFTKKNLGFRFSRVYTEDDTIDSIMVTVDDVTERVRLENELAYAQESRERQTERILEIIEADPRELNLFLSKAEDALNDINESLVDAKIAQDGAVAHENKQKLVEGIFNKVHNIKGNASLLGLQSVVNNASEVEEKLSKLRGQKNFKGDELLTSIVGLAELRELLEEFRDIRVTTLSNFKPQTPTKDLSESESLVTDLNQLSGKIGSEHHKVVNIEANALNLDGLDKAQFQNTKDLLIQLVRNSLIHGIETPEERSQKMKWSEGSIKLKSVLDESSNNILGVPHYTLSYRDDGRGLDPKAIGLRAIELGMITEEQYSTMSNQELSALIFNHGFSSIDVSNEHAGRGAGMELIRDIVRNKMGGKLRMSYQTGDHLEFIISFPKQALSSVEDMNQKNLLEVV